MLIARQGHGAAEPLQSCVGPAPSCLFCAVSKERRRCIQAGAHRRTQAGALRRAHTKADRQALTGTHTCRHPQAGLPRQHIFAVSVPTASPAAVPVHLHAAAPPSLASSAEGPLAGKAGGGAPKAGKAGLKGAAELQHEAIIDESLLPPLQPFRWGCCCICAGGGVSGEALAPAAPPQPHGQGRCCSCAGGVGSGDLAARCSLAGEGAAAAAQVLLKACTRAAGAKQSSTQWHARIGKPLLLEVCTCAARDKQSCTQGRARIGEPLFLEACTRACTLACTRVGTCRRAWQTRLH